MIVEYLIVLGVMLIFLPIILPPLLALLYSTALWSVPPFSWLDRWWDYWVKKSI